jgi:hypothetical protein
MRRQDENLKGKKYLSLALHISKHKSSNDLSLINETTKSTFNFEIEAGKFFTSKTAFGFRAGYSILSNASSLEVENEYALNDDLHAKLYFGAIEMRRVLKISTKIYFQIIPSINYIKKHESITEYESLTAVRSINLRQQRKAILLISKTNLKFSIL